MPSSAPGAFASSPPTVAHLLRHWASVRPDQAFCSVAGTAYTFAELDDRSTRVAAGLAERGVSPGDRVALLAPNRIEFIEVHFALAKLGAIEVPLNAFLKGAFLSHQLSQSRASVLITDGPGFTAALPLLDELPELGVVIALDDVDVPPDLATSVHAFADLQMSQVPFEAKEPSPADTMAIVYTSGTTGLPKGCVLSHGYYVRSARNHAAALELTDADVLYTAMPLFHAGGSMTILTTALLMGIPVHYDQQFSASRFMSRLAETGATVAFAVGAMGLAVLGTPESAADRAHRTHTIMIAPLGPDDQARFTARFGIEPWTSVFGQTECMPVCVTPRSADRDPLACGAPAPDLDVIILGEDGRPVADGAAGEICLRPREPFAMFDGYWDQPESTLASFGQLWYHTGDTGRFLANGELRFVDRRRDGLRRKGENISSLEVEAAIRRHPDISEVAVVAVPSELGEDEIKACVVPASDVQLRPEQLFGFFRETLAYYAIPRYVEFLPSLPVNAVNRVLKHELRDRPITADVWDFTALGFAVAQDARR
jgi:crotonobetaine/carnitine-CoA ligase